MSVSASPVLEPAVPKADKNGFIQPTIDHAACGVGFIAREDGVPTHETLKHGLMGLKTVEHRGGVGADGRTSDGTGILIDIDQNYFKALHAQGTIDDWFKDNDLLVAVGAFFMPRHNKTARTRCHEIIEEELQNFGFVAAVWRDRPINEEVLGKVAARSRPDMRDVMFPQPETMSADVFERNLYFLRRKIEKRVMEEGLSGEGADSFYIPSFSSRTIDYKGLSIAQDLPELYPDLKDPNYKTSSVVFHRRYSTNTAPAWQRSHPYRALAHNGEINSLLTNVNMIGRIERIFATLYPEDNTNDLFPILQQGGTDSAMLDNTVEFLLHAGLSPSTIKMLLVPEAVQPNSELPEDVQKAYEFIDTIMGPWDGPNTMIMRGKNDVTVGGDRGGLRPVRYYRSTEGYLVAGSEDGMIPNIGTITEKGNLKPGDMISVNFEEKRVIYPDELKQMAALELERIFGLKNILEKVQSLPTTFITEKDYHYSTARQVQELRRRQRLGHITQETVEFLDIMTQSGKETLGSMGDTTPAAIASRAYRTLPNFFQQKFAQVTNPPIDSIRERAVMSLKTTIGFPFGANGEKTSAPLIKLDSPILLNAQYKALMDALGEDKVLVIDATFDREGGQGELKRALDEIKAKALLAAKEGKHIVLTDEFVNEDKVAIPPLLVTGAVNAYLIQNNLRESTSLNVRSAEVYGSHDFATYIGLGGADTVNAYMAEETIAAEHKLKLPRFEDAYSSFGRVTPLGQFEKLYRATGHDFTNIKNTVRLRTVREQENVAEFMDAHSHMTLEQLSEHPDETVREQFLSVMDSLGVSVQRLFASQDVENNLKNFKKAAESGLLKIMGKMGIAHVSSYRSGRLFESLGIAQDVIDQCFPGVKSPMNGLSMQQLQERAVTFHQKQYAKDFNLPLSHAGRYAFRTGEDVEPHVLTSEAIDKFQLAVNTGDRKYYDQYREIIKQRSEEFRFAPRDWMDPVSDREPVSVDEVESAEDIMRRFFTGGMSDGSLGAEAHETLAIAMNNIGGKSCSGEGGEHPSRFGTEKRSKVKQMASGRFGTHIDYILDADVVQIKVAQGAKPGEGGELPGHKVEARIAFLRNCEEGTGLISPPPHHDIYSIEDLEQLIYDIKQINPNARVDVKLVSSVGVDIIANGVAKGGADHIHIGGSNGGTGASPLLSMAHAGMPWEVTVNQVHQSLIENDLRSRINLTTDGGMRIGRDVVMAAMLGAEEYGYGLQALIAEGCKLLRSCQNNDCAYGVATTDAELRKKFIGTPQMVENMMRFIAEDTREELAKLGFKSIDEVIGRADLLKQTWGHAKGLDIKQILPGQKADVISQVCALAADQRNDRVDPQDPTRMTIDEKALQDHDADQIIADITAGGTWSYDSDITNEDRTAGSRLSGVLRKKLTDQFGYDYKLDEDTVTLNLKGVAGQSVGAWLMDGMTIRLEGGANDGVGKSLSGGKIVIKPEENSPLADNSQDNVILGNTAFYGAMRGEAYMAGQAGNRFAMRLSGATVVAEGAGTHACNYMTAGTAVLLGEVSENFGSGMSGGEAFVYDFSKKLEARSHADVKNKICSVSDDETRDRLRAIVQKHFDETGSKHAANILGDWDNAIERFKVIRMKEPANRARLDIAA
jgi:glutamate synthase domain-containing protein 2/glutamate synthase domain-containing protein 1/glutamate synthase domain-containing protein 3